VINFIGAGVLWVVAVGLLGWVALSRQAFGAANTEGAMRSAHCPATHRRSSLPPTTGRLTGCHFAFS